jgi:hypothetical protein
LCLGLHHVTAPPNMPFRFNIANFNDDLLYRLLRSTWCSNLTPPSTERTLLSANYKTKVWSSSTSWRSAKFAMLSCCYCHHQHQTSSTYELFPSRAEPPKYALAHTIPQAIYIMLIACFIVSSPRDRQLGTSMWLPSWCHLQFQGRKPDVGWLPVSRFGAAAFDLKLNVPLSDFVIHTVFYRLLHLGTFSRIPGMDNLSRNEEVERGST